MTGRLSGRTALITAAGQGIGRATAELFAAEGATVWATDVNEAALAGLNSCKIRRLDVLSPADIAACMGAVGEPDILFNGAGYVASGTILECKDKDWSFSFDLNVTAMYRLIRAVLPGLLACWHAGMLACWQAGMLACWQAGMLACWHAGTQARRHGVIVNMASVVSSVKSVANRFAYGASKAAVIGLTKGIAADFAGQGIRCNAICPDTVETPSLHDRLSATGDHDAAWTAFTARQPMGRVGRAEEIAALALYLASDDSAFTTGQAHVIDGGWSN